jgi:hypothetical protein
MSDFVSQFPVPSFPIIFHPTDKESSWNDVEQDTQSDAVLPAIFARDPQEWFKFVDHHVHVLLDNDVTKHGVLYTIDPVSEAIVLINITEEKGIRTEIILSHIVKEIILVAKADKNLLQRLQNLFDEELNHVFSVEELTAKCNDVKNWLDSNRIPVELGGENADVIEVAGKALIIKAPYDVENCFSLNEIILRKVQKLLENKPSTT